ncbi:Copper transport protein [Cercospora zeina]
MATSTGMASSSDMSSMHSSMMMDMSQMMMTFFTSTTTALYSNTWTPTSQGQYAGTCIFLICLGVLFRGLVALRYRFNTLWTRSIQKQDTAILRPKTALNRDIGSSRRPWRINEAATRACLDTVLAGVSYLLMLAVMTMNVGYFSSVLGGIFLGSFVFGGPEVASGH